MDQAELIESSTASSSTLGHAKKRRFSLGRQSKTALSDYFFGLLSYHLWLYMAYSDIRRRYRRTLIGPFWATLSLAISVGVMGFLFSNLWHTDVKTFLPYFASGFVCWTFVSSIITDSCSTFISSEGLLKQISLPYSTFAWLVFARNFLLLLHQIVVFIAIALFFHVSLNANTLLLMPGFFLLFISSSWIAILLGLFCARYRDVSQVVSSLLQISMFVTPIFWPVKQLGQGTKAYILVNGNPLYHYISIIRYPMLGQAPSAISWWFVSILTFIGWIFTMWIMAKKQNKLIYWL